ncbi:MAG: protein containing nucleotide-diphospho-sugar transferase domain [Segetibacter sp.]|nr:protein containing nucleotide-diphospho-sugar transferase domain [Segetibacter sp.]
MQQLTTPILFIIFNRPEITAKVFNQIKEVQPTKLYVAADGPRKNKAGELQLCEASREAVLSNITWNCEVRSLIRNENVGCKIAVSSAITWFFENEEQGIILEDDCLPDKSFFNFCNLLLEMYKDEESVMQISGCNLLGENIKVDHSYYFSRMCHIWGWATWRRAWKLYDIKMNRLNELFDNFEEISTDKRIKNYWSKVLNEVKENKIDTWDYQWVYSIWVNKGLVISPAVNMISNIGFGPDATHTVIMDKTVANLKANAIDIMKHPSSMRPNIAIDNYDMKKTVRTLSIIQNIRIRASNIYKRFTL